MNQKHSIVLVNTDLDLASKITAFLELKGFTVITGYSFPQNTDVFIVDAKSGTGRIVGPDIARGLHERHSNAKIIGIITDPSATAPLPGQFIDAGADDVWSKQNMDMDRLFTIIERLLSD